MYTLTLKDNNKKIMSIPGNDLAKVTFSMLEYIISKYQIKQPGDK